MMLRLDVRGSLEAAVLLALGAGAAAAQEQPTYRNPLPVVSEDGPVTSCADPSVVDDPAGGWVMYCTTDPLSGEDLNLDGNLVFRFVPTFRSEDLVRWSYVGDDFARRAGANAASPPAWASDSALFWAPAGKEIDGRHYLLFGVTDVDDAVSGEAGCASDNAIGYAVSDSPTGPWVAGEEPLIAPRRGDGEGCDFLWTYDPEVV